MNNYRNGFTLIEMVLVLVIIAIIAGTGSHFMVTPIRSFVLTAKQGVIIDEGRMALERMTLDINNSIPDSIRVIKDKEKNKVMIEFLPILEEGVYLQGEIKQIEAKESLDLTKPASDFDVLGEISKNYFNDSDIRLVINHQLKEDEQGNPLAGVNLYSQHVKHINKKQSHVITPLGNKVTLYAEKGYNHIHLSQPHQFNSAAISSKFYITKTPVSYIFDAKTKQLTRHWNYPITEQASFNLGGESAVISNYIHHSNFNYFPMKKNQKAHVDLLITLNIAKNAEANLVKQITLNES